MPTPELFVDFRVLTITAEEGGQTYEYPAYLLPGGEVLVPAETCADTFWPSLGGLREALKVILAARGIEVPAEAMAGTDEIVEIRETGGLSRWTMEEITEAVQQSAREFGEDAIPESLKFLLGEDEEVARAWGAEVDRRASDLAQTYPWEEVKAMVFKA